VSVRARDTEALIRARWGLLGVLSGVRILVVEDDPDVREATRLFLEAVGARVLTAVDGADALQQLAASDTPDVIVSDLTMPRLDGYALIKRVRRDRGRYPPAIAVSALGNSIQERTVAAGFDAYVAKPFDEAGLWAALQRVAFRHPTLFKPQRKGLRWEAMKQRRQAREIRRVARSVLKRRRTRGGPSTANPAAAA
jgi:CheY-like chemotaxis protein